MSDKIKVLVVEPMKPCRVQEISDTLDAMRQIVGGDIEAVTSIRYASAIVCNENGKILDLPYNRPLLDESGLLPLDILRGTFFIAGMSGEHFVSLTDEQIQHYKNLYDNAAVLTAERPENQAEIAPEAAMPDFAVSCQITFHMICEDKASPASYDAFISHVTGIFNRDDTLAERTVGDLDFTFRGRRAEVRYTFARQDKDEASAEMFSKQCVLDVQDALEGYGCRIEKIDCIAEELEKDLSRGREPQEKRKKGTHHER